MEQQKGPGGKVGDEKRTSAGNLAEAKTANGITDRMQRLEEVLEELVELLENKQQRTVNNNTRTLARQVKTAFNGLKREMGKKQTIKEPALASSLTQELALVSEELFITPVGKFLINPTKTPKRKANSPPSTEKSRGNKRVNQQNAAPPVKQLEHDQQEEDSERNRPETQDWKIVGRTRKKQREKTKKKVDEGEKKIPAKTKGPAKSH